jgi:hypothetical protein
VVINTLEFGNNVKSKISFSDIFKMAQKDKKCAINRPEG